MLKPGFIFLLSLVFSLSAFTAQAPVRAVPFCENVVFDLPAVLLGELGPGPEDAAHFPKQNLSLGKKESESSFLEFLNVWGQMQRADEITPILQKLSQETEISKEEIKTLKTVRKAALALRSAFQLFDESHSVPKEFDKFVILLGRVNDLLASEKTTAAERAQGAEIVLSRMRGDVLKQKALLKKFRPAPRSSFVSFVSDKARESGQFLQHEILSGEEQHDLRKNLRLFVFLHLARWARSHSSATWITYRNLLRLTDALGNERDQLIQGNENPDHVDFVMPQDLRTKIQTYLQSLEIP